NSANELPPLLRVRGPRVATDSVTYKPDRVPDALVERNLEPDLEQNEDRRTGHHPDHHAPQPAIFADPAHERGDENGRRYVDPDQLHGEDVDDRGNQHRCDEPELTPFDEAVRLLVDRAAESVALLPAGQHGVRQRHEARQAQQQADIERKVARLRTVVAPAG